MAGARPATRGVVQVALISIETGTHATRILLRGTRATGVEFVKQDGARIRVDADCRSLSAKSGSARLPFFMMLPWSGSACMQNTAQKSSANI